MDWWHHKCISIGNIANWSREAKKVWRERLPGNEDLKCVRIGQGSESINVKSRYSTLGWDFAEYRGEATKRKATLKSCQHVHKSFCYSKNCHRHYEPEGWDQLTKFQTNSNTYLDHISSSESWLKASTKNFNQTSASLLNLTFKILTKPSFRILTKMQLHNLYKTSAAICWTNSGFKILPEL